MRKTYLILIILYVVLLIYFYQPQNYIKDEGDLELYFCQKTNCSHILIQLIEMSSDVKCAFYDLSEQNIIESLKNKDVLIFEENSLEGFKSVSSASLMHHKFCIFDNEIVLTGSWNPTFRGTYLNDNLILLIHSDKISKAYLNEWKSLGKSKNKGNYKFNLSGTLIDLCFSPQGKCENIIIDEIDKSKEVKFLTFTFTSSNIAKAISNKNYSGIIEKSQRSKYTVDLNYLFDSNPYTMHEKVFILDDDRVILGSYNPTKNANERNDENLLVIHNKNINILMKEEFNRIISFIN